MTPHKPYGIRVSAELAEFLVCCTFRHPEQKSQWARSSKMLSSAPTKLQSSTDPILFTTEKGHILFFNASFDK